ncbi:hypothetical protein [Methylobacterium currus]|uniref:hypothetical protein n=1 Tax=Methylobacterium currus TaxID=2051553 RepID=UPI0013DF77DF|nr:hypothetical protein [Methylobacterium currus]
MNDRRHTAIHEAGHAVIGRVVTMACGGATIVADDESAGHSVTADPYAVLAAWEAREKWRPSSSVWVGRILAYMAGAEAEEVILGGCQGGDGDDRRWITDMLYEIAPRTSTMPGKPASAEPHANSCTGTVPTSRRSPGC